MIIRIVRNETRNGGRFLEIGKGNINSEKLLNEREN